MLEEAVALVQLKFFSRPLYPRQKGDNDIERCYELLKLTSRSFAAVIEQLHPRMRDAVMIFYLILRGLDTIEDDPGLDRKVKVPLLRGFRQVLARSDWTFHDSSPTEKDRVVLQEFDRILRVFHQLKSEYQDIIADITGKMGNGMADYLPAEDESSHPNYKGTETVHDYDVYCHHVAGIVGEGLTRMALVAGFVTQDLAEKPHLYESMGLFLQKTNIIRDFREDVDDGRSFWPKEIWSKYSSTDLREFVAPENEQKALECVSDLLVQSLRHVTDVLEYLANVREPSLFRFCAIPQVMSIATLELVYCNPRIFHTHEKISKGLAAKLILGATDMTPVFAVFREYVRRIHKRSNPSDPNFLAIELSCSRIEQFINAHDPEFAKAHPTPAQKKAEHEDFMEGVYLILTALGTLTVTFGLMVYITILFGAKYPNPLTLIKEQYDFFVS